MPRKLRVQYPGASYHVMSRAGGQTLDWFIFLPGPWAHASGASGVPLTGCRMLRGQDRKRRLWVR
jgi:hypothetical protein